MDYKVCILAAGKGTRNKYGLNSNKALLPLGKQLALAYQISQFPPDIPIVIAVGFNANLIKTFVQPWGNRITCVDVKYEGKGVGPGYSLLCCNTILQCPFVYMACDTIVTDKIPQPTKNWIGVYPVREKEPYLTMRIDRNNMVKQVFDKGERGSTYLASIGLFGIRDYETFWAGLVNPQKLIQGEHQDTPGLNALIPHKLHALYFNWHDIGTTEGYERTVRAFNQALSHRAD